MSQLSEKRGKSREIIIKHTGEYSKSETVLKIIKSIVENKGRCALSNEHGRKEQHRDIREDKQG